MSYYCRDCAEIKEFNPYSRCEACADRTHYYDDKECYDDDEN